jgi:hypothetical protein
MSTDCQLGPASSATQAVTDAGSLSLRLGPRARLPLAGPSRLRAQRAPVVRGKSAKCRANSGFTGRRPLSGSTRRPQAGPGEARGPGPGPAGALGGAGPGLPQWPRTPRRSPFRGRASNQRALARSDGRSHCAAGPRRGLRVPCYYCPGPAWSMPKLDPDHHGHGPGLTVTPPAPRVQLEGC